MATILHPSRSSKGCQSNSSPKATLAKLHPCLVADPQSSDSLFAAAGVAIGTDIKTITAKTVFDRMAHVTTRFDTKTKLFCLNLSLKRNSELHSGEAPFEASEAAAWEGRFWHSVDIILATMGQSIETWLGADQGRAPQALLDEYTHAIVEATKVRVDTAREAFEALSKKEREALHERAVTLNAWDIRRAFRTHDETWDVTCPACESRSFIAGVIVHEEISDEDDPETGEETVDVTLAAEEFHCPTSRKIEDFGLNLPMPLKLKNTTNGSTTRQRRFP